MTYSADDKMALLISGDSALLQVISCFGLRLGFGNRTVQEVCDEAGVDCATFLTVVNFVADGFSRIDANYDQLSLVQLVDYLRQAHVYFLKYLLPDIRSKLQKAVASSKDKVSQLILSSFDEYAEEVKKHMDYEDNKVFTYVEDLVGGCSIENYKITTYSKHHDLVSDRLTELKSLLVKYTPADVDRYLLTSALLDIYACEKGLEWHCKIEDYLFSPAVLNYEKSVIKNEN